MSAARAEKPTGSGAERGAQHREDDASLEQTRDAKYLARVWPFVRPHRAVLYASLALIVTSGAVSLARPLVMGRVVARAQAADADGIFVYGISLAVLVLALQFLDFAKGYTLQVAGARAMTDLRARVFEVLQRIALPFYDRTPVGRLVTRATGDIDSVGELFSSGVFHALGDVVALVGIVGVMLYLDVRMSLIAFACAPIAAVVVLAVRGYARRAFRAIRAKAAELNSHLNEQVMGMSVIQAYAREARMAEDFAVVNTAHRDAQRRAIFFEAMIDAAVETVSTICLASILWWAGFRRVSDPTITFPLVVTFTQYTRQFFQPLGLIAQRFTILQSAMSGAERVFRFLDEAEVESDGGSAVASTGATEEEAVVLENVTFAYKPGVPVLHDVSLRVARGERVALVGATGAGKTTITSVLLRLYELSSGAARVHGRDLSSFPRKELRSLFSVVPQDVFLFPGTIASNIAMGGAPADRARVETALKQIGALDLFEKREGGLDAPVDERGANFSAGERQLIAFARALYRDTPLLILDEATASIDSETEARLQKALDAVMRGRTSIVIAHRLSTIRAADRIVVMHRGRVVETGTHDELIARGGVYAKLHRLQFAIEEREKLALAPDAPLASPAA